MPCRDAREERLESSRLPSEEARLAGSEEKLVQGAHGALLGSLVTAALLEEARPLALGAKDVLLRSHPRRVPDADDLLDARARSRSARPRVSRSLACLEEIGVRRAARRASSARATRSGRVAPRPASSSRDASRRAPSFPGNGSACCAMKDSRVIGLDAEGRRHAVVLVVHAQHRVRQRSRRSDPCAQPSRPGDWRPQAPDSSRAPRRRAPRPRTRPRALPVPLRRRHARSARRARQSETPQDERESSGRPGPSKNLLFLLLLSSASNHLVEKPHGAVLSGGAETVRREIRPGGRRRGGREGPNGRAARRGAPGPAREAAREESGRSRRVAAGAASTGAVGD